MNEDLKQLIQMIMAMLTGIITIIVVITIAVALTNSIKEKNKTERIELCVQHAEDKTVCFEDMNKLSY